MQPQAQRRKPVGREGRKRRRIERHGVGGVISARARGFQARDIGQIGERCRRREGGDKGGEIVAVFAQDFRARRMRRHEQPRHREEEFLADDALGGGKARAQCVDKADHDIVAVDGKAAVRRPARVGGEAAGQRGVRIEQGLRELLLQGDHGRLPQAAWRAPARSRMALAACASAASTGQAGTSLSHSIRVGSGPAASITRA